MRGGVVVLLAVDRAEELEGAQPVAALDILSERLGDRRPLGAVAPELRRLLEQHRIEIDVGRRLALLAQ